MSKAQRLSRKRVGFLIRNGESYVLNLKLVNQVANGIKKSHSNYVFLDFFKLSKEDKQKCIDNNLIEIRD